MAETPTTERVTTRDIILRLEGKVDALVEQMAARTVGESVTSKAVSDHEKRLRNLERWRYAIPASIFSGFGAVLTAVLAVLFGPGFFGF